jgi:hypothetical protein
MKTEKKKQPILINLVICLIFCLGASFLYPAASRPAGLKLLYVDVSEEEQGRTYLAIRSLEISDSTRITPAMFQIVAPVVCEKTGMIGFTHHTAQMKTAVYIIQPDGKGPVKVVDGASLDDFSPDGASLLITSTGQKPATSIFNLKSRESIRISQNLMVTSAKWSPLQDRVAVSALTSRGTNDLYLITLQTQTVERLTSTPSVDEFSPFFTKDGKSLGFASRADEVWRVEYMDLTNKQRTVSKPEGLSPSLSPDNDWILTESENEIILWSADGQDHSSLGPGRTPAWISEALAKRYLSPGGPTPPQDKTQESPIAVKAEVTAHVSKPNPDKKNPFDEEPLAIAIEGAEVVCEFTDQSRPVRLTGTTDKNGQVRFEVPLDSPVTLTWGQEKETVTCTIQAPKRSVYLGGVKIKTVSTSPIKK